LKTSKISIHDFFNSKKLSLPIIQNKSLTFRESLYKVFDEFLIDLNKLSPKGLGFVNFSVEKKPIENLIEELKKAIDTYLNGYPARAYCLFDSPYIDPILSILKSGKYKGKTQFYRLRHNEDNFSKNKTELFHIAFDTRGRVATQRYSISGFPCLYLANSIYVAWEEIRRKPLSQIQAARFESTKPIKYLDLVTEIYSSDKLTIDSTNETTLWNYIRCWPLLAACSVKVFDDQASFKPEYIVPQLLLQRVRDEGKLDGIRFSSTHIDLNSVNSKGKFYNLVIPVKDLKDKGHCDSLNSLFKMTEVVSWQLMDAAVGHLHKSKPPSTAQINPNVERIEIIKGGVYPYEYSPFSQMEIYLNTELKAEHVS